MLKICSNLVFCFLALSVNAQIAFFKSIKAKSLSIEYSTHTGDFRSVDFSDFQSQARFGELFDTPGENYFWKGHLVDQSFNLLINFKMKEETLGRHEFLLGIKKVNQTVDWLSHGDSSFSGYQGRSEMAKFVVGYSYYLINGNWIRFSGGPMIDYGFTISSFTTEFTNEDQYEYFGYRGSSIGFEIPILLSIKLLKKSFIYFGPSYGAGYYSQDGFGQVIFTKSFMVGFRLDL